MQNTEMLKTARNLLLKLHKKLVDHERALYENIHGSQTASQFLNLLLEDQTLSWLRKFSTLIVEIDEMFDQKDGFSEVAVNSHIAALRSLINMNDENKAFIEKYQAVLEHNLEAAELHGDLKALLT